MRRLFLLLGVCFVTALMIAPAAGAQTSGGQAAMVAGSPPPPVYVVEADGTVINEGDVVTDCYSFLVGYQQGYQGYTKEESQAVVDKCQQLGSPSGDLTTGNSEVVLSLGTAGLPASSSSGEFLPNTGGLPLALMVTLAASLALIGLGGLTLKRASSYR